MLVGLNKSLSDLQAAEPELVLYSQSSSLVQQMVAFRQFIGEFRSLSPLSRLIIEGELINEICALAKMHVRWLLEGDAEEACDLIDSFASSCNDLRHLPALLDAIRDINDQRASQKKSLSRAISLLRQDQWYAAIVTNENAISRICELEHESVSAHRTSDVNRIDLLIGEVISSSIMQNFLQIQRSPGLASFLAGPNGQLSFSVHAITSTVQALAALGDASRLLDPVARGVTDLIDSCLRDIHEISGANLSPPLHDHGPQSIIALGDQATMAKADLEDLWSNTPCVRVGCLVRYVKQIDQLAVKFVSYAERTDTYPAHKHAPQ